MKLEILLKAYVVHQSEDAFRELVAVSLDEVYSTALRIARGASHLAEETALRVYWELARKAPKLSEDGLASWLRQHTCKTAVIVMREDGRYADRLALKNEMQAASVPAPRGLATRVCQGVLLNAARRRDFRDFRRFFQPTWPDWIRPWHFRAAAGCGLVAIVLLNVPFHRRHPIIRAPDVRLTPSSFAQLGNPDEEGSAPPRVEADKKTATNPSQP
jgi:hypothetical protein